MGRVIYVIGPYRAETLAGVRRNIERAREVAEWLWSEFGGMGVAVICPHLNSALMDGVAKDKVFLDGDLEILRRCDGAVCVPGWQFSEGSCGEVTLCNETNRRVWDRLHLNHFGTRREFERWIQDGRVCITPPRLEGSETTG